MIGEMDLWRIINKCKHLKFKSNGDFAVGKFHLWLDVL